LDSTLTSSNGVPGKARAFEPVAMMMFLPVIDSSVLPATLMA
jgi:hypothetical protein